MDLRQTDEWEQFLKGMGWLSLKIEQPTPCQIRIKKIPFWGSIVKIQRPPSPAPLAEIEEALKPHRPLFIKIEPLNESQLPEMGQRGYRRDNWPLIASRTVVIDLTPPWEEIVSRYSKDTRQSLRKTQALNQVRVIRQPAEEEVKALYRLLKSNSHRHHFWLPPYRDLINEARVFGDRAWLFLVSLPIENSPIGGALVTTSNDTAFYRHAAVNETGLNNYAGYAILNAIIKTMKEVGFKKLDLEGIYDERFSDSTKRWQGFTIFKKKWGGEVVTFPGSFTKAYHPLFRLVFTHFGRRYPEKAHT